MPIIAITTNNSINVKADEVFLFRVIAQPREWSFQLQNWLLWISEKN